MFHLPPVAQGVLAISAVALAIVRLLTASKPFWAWERVPVWVQKALPAALMAFAALPTAIEHARSWVDILVGLVITAGTWFMASRGDKRPPEDKSGGPRIDRTNSDPRLDRSELDVPVSIRPPQFRIWRPLWLLVVVPVLLMTLLPALALQGCDPRRPPCDESKLQAADRRYIERVGAECLPRYDRKEDCPAWPALKAEHSRELKEICP